MNALNTFAIEINAIEQNEQLEGTVVELNALELAMIGGGGDVSVL
jgi:hypothetical protein